MKVGIEEWLVKLAQPMYRNVKSRCNINGSLSDGFLVQVGSHQRSALNCLLFSIVLEALP